MIFYLPFINLILELIKNPGLFWRLKNKSRLKKISILLDKYYKIFLFIFYLPFVNLILEIIKFPELVRRINNKKSFLS